MIIYSCPSKQIGEKALDIACSVCGTLNLFIQCFQKVFALYWVPTIPLKKEKVVQCKHCGTLSPFEIYSNYVSSNEGTFSTPWWYFAGSIIIGGLVLFVAYVDIFLT